MGRPDKREIKERYDQLGGQLYDTRYAEEQENKYKQIIEYLGKGRTLDNGCGTGLLLEHLEEYSIGLDLSAELLRKASKRKQFLVHGDSENLPFRNDVFDNMTAITVIQNISNPSRMISDALRVVKSNGVLVISSLKRVYTLEEFKKLVKKDGLTATILDTAKNINDWVAVIRNTM